MLQTTDNKISVSFPFTCNCLSNETACVHWPPPNHPLFFAALYLSPIYSLPAGWCYLEICLIVTVRQVSAASPFLSSHLLFSNNRLECQGTINFAFLTSRRIVSRQQIRKENSTVSEFLKLVAILATSLVKRRKHLCQKLKPCHFLVTIRTKIIIIVNQQWIIPAVSEYVTEYSEYVNFPITRRYTALPYNMLDVVGAMTPGNFIQDCLSFVSDNPPFNYKTAAWDTLM